MNNVGLNVTAHEKTDLCALGDAAIKASAVLLSAMANRRRLQILSILLDEEVSVGELSQRVGISQSALSQHLGRLRGILLVTTRRDAQTIYYSCDSPKVRRLIETLNSSLGRAEPPKDVSL